MKLLLLLTTTLLTISLLETTVLADSPPFPIFGPCQKRCIGQFGEIKERMTNTDTLYREVDVFNKTEFSLCKLGCNSPEYTDLNLPAFRYGQSAYQQILMSVDDKPSRETVVKDVSILCLDNFPYTAKNSSATTSKRVLTGKVLLALDDGVPDTENVYFVEVVGRDADDDDTYIVYQDWCYSSNCNVTFNAPIGLADLEVRLRVSTFDEIGAVGGIVLSRWYNINHILSSTSVDMSLKSVEWNDDKAAARLAFDEATSVHVPACSLQMMYKNALSSEFKHVNFYLDHTRQVIVKKLDFNQTYTMRLVPASESNRPTQALATTRFQVPACSDMVNDMSMCAPPPVSTLTSHWNLSSTNGYGLTIDWTYYSDGLKNQTAIISMSHFMFTVHPLITPNNEKCEKYEPIRRDVTYTHRKVVFYVPDAECNYEVEVSAFDTKQRRSDVKKIKIMRVNEPSYMSLLLASDIPTSLGLGAIVIAFIVVLALVLIVFIQKKRNAVKKLDVEQYGSGERMVYAYVDATEASRTVVGVRPFNLRFEPVENIQRNIEAAVAHQRTYGYNLHNGARRAVANNELYPYYQRQNPIKIPPHMMLRIQPNGTAESSAAVMDEHPYETILDYRFLGSEISDEVFEQDICTPSPNSSFTNQESSLPIAPFAAYEEYPTLNAIPFQDLQFRKDYKPEGDPCWRMTSVVDLVRGGSFSMKYARDVFFPADDNIKALRRELAFLSTFHPHGNCVRFDGIVLGRWEHCPYQVLGMLMENCRGGSLHSYIISVGSMLRRQAMNTPTQSPQGAADHLRGVDGSPSPSSGYESYVSGQNTTITEQDRKTPDRLHQAADPLHHFNQVARRFCQFAEQVSSALEHLHCAGIVHTHVTTISIYLFRDYTDPLDMLCDQVVKLGDFGHAARSADEVVVDQNLQPPEVALGKKYEAKGDIWQFGTCLAEMCSLGIPFQAQKQIPASGLDEFDKLPSTAVLQEAAKKCLNARHRPTATDLRGVFQADTARDIKAMDQMKQSLLI